MFYQGIVIGALSFLIIGFFHPIVVKAEFYYGKQSWKWFLLVGILFSTASLFVSSVLISALLSLVGFSSLWSIMEVVEQETRVQKGWFPPNPKRKGAIVIRHETSADFASIRRINEEAYFRLDEALLVEKLRKKTKFTEAISLVAVKSNIVVGHLLLYPINIQKEGESMQVFCLTTVAVFPSFQGQGVASALVNKAIELAKESQTKAIFTHKAFSYFSSFGFEKMPLCCWEGITEQEHNLVGMLPLGTCTANQLKGELQLPKEFNLLKA